MKKAFIMPIVLILMSMLLGVSLVLSKMAESRTQSLMSQEDSYYSGKEIVIKIVSDEEGSIDFFKWGLSTYYEDNPGDDNNVTFKGDARYISDNKSIPTHQLNIDEWLGSGDLVKDEAVWRSISKFEIPEFPGTGNRDYDVNTGEFKELNASEHGNLDDLDVETGGKVRFKNNGSEEYKIRELETDENAVLIFQPGDYWIEELELEEGSEIQVEGNGTVRLYITKVDDDDDGEYDDDDILENVRINITSGSKAENLMIISKGRLHLKGSSIVGSIYSEDEIKIENGNFRGVMRAKGIEISYGSTVKDEKVPNLDLGQAADWIINQGESDCW